ncbi:MAG: hypothetical protein KBH21_00480 [Acetoanaerobium sp.]|nr:hypothetical protein [Acetoanaerobium sp.]
MNEDLIKLAFSKFEGQGDYDTFKKDFLNDIKLRELAFSKLESSGGTFEDFEKDLGLSNAAEKTPPQKSSVSNKGNNKNSNPPSIEQPIMPNWHKGLFPVKEAVGVTITPEQQRQVDKENLAKGSRLTKGTKEKLIRVSGSAPISSEEGVIQTMLEKGKGNLSYDQHDTRTWTNNNNPTVGVNIDPVELEKGFYQKTKGDIQTIKKEAANNPFFKVDLKGRGTDIKTNICIGDAEGNCVETLTTPSINRTSFEEKTLGLDRVNFQDALKLNNDLISKLTTKITLDRGEDFIQGYSNTISILNNLAKKLESLSRDIEKKDNSDEGVQFFKNIESRGNAINAISSEIEGVNKTLSGYNKEFEALEEEQLNLGVQYKTGALPYTDYLRLFNEAAAKKDNVISEFNEVAARGKELETQYLSSIDLYNKEKAKAPSNPLITEYNKTRERLTEVMRAYRVYEDDEDFQELLKAYGKSEDFKDVFKVFAPEEHRQKILLEAQEAYANAVTLERNSKTRGGKAWMDFKNTLQILGGTVEITKDINPFGQINTPTGGGFVPNIASLFGGWVLNTANDFFSLAELGLNKVGVDEKTLKKVENFRRDELSFPQSMGNAAMGGAKRHFYEEQLELKSSNIGDESLYEVFKPGDKLVIDNGEVVGIRSKDSDILEGFLSEDTKNAAQNIYNANKDKTTSSFSLVGGIEDAVPSILDLVAMMYGGSAITKMARGFRLPVVPVLEKYGIKTGTVLGDGVIRPTTSVGFSFLQQYGDIYDSHIQRGVGVSDALNYAFKETAVSSFMEIMFSPFEMKLQKSVNSRMFGQLIDAKNATIRDVISGRTPLIGWGDTFLKYTKQKGGALVENYVKDVIPEVVTEILQNYNSAHWEAESKDEMTKLPSFSENVNAAFGAAFITAAVGLPSANSKYNIDLRATVTYNAVNNPNGIISDTDFKTVQEAKEWLNKYGLVTTDEKLKKKAQQIVLAYDEILPQVKKELEAFEGENLTEEQKVAIAGAALDKAIAKAKLLKETDKSSRLSNKLGSTIAMADAQIDYIVKNPDALTADPILKSRNWSLVHEDRDKHKGVIIWDKGVSADREYKVGDKVDFGSLGSITITEIGKDASGNPMFRYETNDKKKAKRQETQNQDNTEEEEVTTESTTSAQREGATTTDGEQVTEEVVPQGGEVKETVEGVDFSVGNYDIKGDKVAKRQVSADGATTTTVDVEVKDGQTVQEAIEEHIDANRRQELDSVSNIINQEDKAYLEERINQRADKDLQDVKDAFKDRGTPEQTNEQQTQPTEGSTTATEVSEPINEGWDKDVESTAKALEGVRNPKILDKIAKLLGGDKFVNKFRKKAKGDKDILRAQEIDDIVNKNPTSRISIKGDEIIFSDGGTLFDKLINGGFTEKEAFGIIDQIQDAFPGSLKEFYPNSFKDENVEDINFIIEEELFKRYINKELNNQAYKKRLEDIKKRVGNLEDGDFVFTKKSINFIKEILNGIESGDVFVFTKNQLSDLGIEQKISNRIIDSFSLSEAYHKAKADGSNPELVKAVEELLKPKEPTKVQEVKQEVEVQEQQETAKVEETPKKTAPKAETNKITFKLTNTGEKEFTKVGDLWQYEVGGKTKTVRSESNIAALDKELARVNSLEANTPTTPQQGEVVNEVSKTKNTTKAPLSVEDVISKLNKLLVDPKKKNNRANVSLFGLDIVFNGIKDNIGIPLWNRAIKILSNEVEKGTNSGKAIIKAANYIENNIKGKDWGRKAFINNFKFYFSRLEGINSKGVTVSITPYAGARIQKYKNLQDSLNAFITAGNFKAAQEVAKEMQDDLIFRLNQLLPDVKIKGKSVDGLWQGSAEQSFSLHIDKVSDDVFAAIVKIAQDFDQDAVHILYLSDKINNDEIVGVEDANGRAIIPVVNFEFKHPITAAEFGKIVKDNGIDGASLDSDGYGAVIYDSTMYATKEEAEKGHKIFYNKINNIENDSKRITGAVRANMSEQRFAAFKRSGQEKGGRTYAWGHGNIQKSDEYRARENDERTAAGWAVRHLPKKVRDAVQKVASLTPKIGTYLNLNKSSDDYKRLQSIGRMFDRMPLVDLSPKVKAAYNTLNEIIKAQYDRLPIKVYPNNRPIISHENIEQIQGIVNELNTAIEAKDIKKITELQKQLDNVVGWSENRYDDAYSNSKQMMADVNRNNQMEFFTTGSGFGDGSVDYTGHPLLEPTYYYTTPVPAQDKNGKIIYDKDGNEVLIPKQLSNNDVLRVVHDYVAHAASGASFGAKGEERAWAAHVASIINEQGFSDRQKLIAIQALTSETRGQNTWVNFVNEFNRDIRNPLLEIKRNAEKNNDLDTAAKADEMLSELPYTEFADQKVGLLPTETMIGGYESTADSDKWIKDKLEKEKLYESDQSEGNMKEQSLPEDISDVGEFIEGVREKDNKNNTENENNLSEILDKRGIDDVSLQKLNEYGKQIEQGTIGIAPALSNEIEGLSDVEKGLLKDEYGKKLDKTINDIANATGVKIISSNNSAGGWFSGNKNRNIIEPSKGVTVEYETKEQLEAFANLLGALAPEIQEGVYVAEYDENGADVEYAFTFDTVENGQKVVDVLHTFKKDENDADDNGLGDGFRYDTTTNTLYIGDLGNQNTDKILKLLDYATENGLRKHEQARANISFPSNGDYSETLRRVRDTYNRDGLFQEQKDSFNTLYEQAQERLREQADANSDIQDVNNDATTLKEAAKNLKDAVIDLFIGGNNKLGIHYDPKMEALNFYNKGGKVFKTFVDLMKSVATQAGVATMDSKGKLVWKEWANVTQQEKDGLFTEFRNALTRLNTNINIDEDGLEYLALWASDSELMKAKVKAISALQDEIDSLYESFARGETNRQDFAIKVQEVLKDFNRDQKNTSYFSASDIAKLLKAAKDVKDTASLNNFENKFYDIVSGKDFNKLKAATVKLKKAAIRAIQTIKNPNTTSNNPNGVTQGKERLALSYNPLDKRAYNKLPQVLNLQRLPNESNTAYKRAQRLEAERLYREDIRRFNDMLTVMANKEIGKDSAKYKNDINYFADMAAHQFNIKEQEKALRESTYDTDGNLLDIYGNIETLYQDLPAEYQEVADVRKLQFDNNGNIIDTDGNIIKDFNSLDEKELRELERRKKLEDKELNKIQTAAEKEQARLDNKDKIRNLINIGRQVLPFKEFQAILDDFLSITDEQLEKLSNQELEELIKGYDNLINLNRVNTGFEYLIKKALDGSVATEVINTLDSRGNSFRSLLRDRITNIFKGKNIVDGIERFMRNTPLRRIDAIFSGKEGTEMYDTFIYKIAQGMGVFTAFSNKLKDEYRGLTKSIKQDDEFLLRLYTMDRQYRNNPDSDEIMSVAEEVELIREAISLDKNLKESLYADFVELYDKLQMEHGGEFDYTKIQLDKRQQALLDFVDTHLDNTVGKVVVTAARTGEATKIYNNYTPLGRVSSKSITDEMKDFADGIMDFDGGVANREYFSPITPGFIKARQSGKISPIRDVLFSRVTYEAIRGIHLDYNMRDAFKTFENRIKDTERELDNKIKDIRKDAKDKVEKLTEQLENQKQVLTFQLQGADARTARVLNGQIADIDKQIKALDESDIIKASEEKIDAYKNDKMFIQVMGKVVKDVAKDTLHNQYTPLSEIDVYTELVASVGYASVLTSIPRGMAEFASNIFYASLYPVEMMLGVKQLAKMLKDDKSVNRLKELLTQIPSTQPNRLIVHSGSLRRDTAETKKFGIAATVGRGKRIVENLTSVIDSVNDAILGTSDRVISMPMWLGAFEKEFNNQKRIEIKNRLGRSNYNSEYEFNAAVNREFKKERLNLEEFVNNSDYRFKNKVISDKAVKFADRVLTVGFASFNAFEGIPNLKMTKGDGFLKVYDKFLQRFNKFEYQSFEDSISSLLGRGYLSKSEAARVLTATLSRLAIYNYLAGKLRDWWNDEVFAPAINNVSNTIGEALGVEGDKDLVAIPDRVDNTEEEDLYKKKRAFIGGLISVSLQRRLGGLGRLPINFAVEMANGLYGEDLGLRKGAEYNAYENSLLFSTVKIPNFTSLQREDGELSDNGLNIPFTDKAMGLKAISPDKYLIDLFTGIAGPYSVFSKNMADISRLAFRNLGVNKDLAFLKTINPYKEQAVIDYANNIIGYKFLASQIPIPMAKDVHVVMNNSLSAINFGVAIKDNDYKNATKSNATQMDIELGVKAVERLIKEETSLMKERLIDIIESEEIFNKIEDAYINGIGIKTPESFTVALKNEKGKYNKKNTYSTFTLSDDSVIWGTTTEIDKSDFEDLSEKGRLVYDVYNGEDNTTKYFEVKPVRNKYQLAQLNKLYTYSKYQKVWEDIMVKLHSESLFKHVEPYEREFGVIGWKAKPTKLTEIGEEDPDTEIDITKYFRN